MKYSASRLYTLSRCTKQFHYKYVANEPPDTFYITPRYFNFGHCFHKCLELTEHGTKNIDQKTTVDELIEGYNLADDDGAKVRRMFIAYCEWFEQSGFILHAVEQSFESQQFNGIVDAIFIDNEGKWFIVDTKTPGTFDVMKVSMLSLDLQMNIYNDSFREIAKIVNLSPKDYAGMLYIEIKKPAQRLGKTECVKEYTARLTTDIKVTFVDKNKFYNVQVMRDLEAMMIAGNNIASTNMGYFPNKNSCVDNGYACPYFEKCQGIPFYKFCGVINE